MAEQQAAFQALLDLAHQSRSSAKGLPSQVDITPHWSGIGFELLGQLFVAPMGEVAELLEVPSATRLPGVKGWVKGVANVRGRLLPLYDLAGYFGESLSGQRKQYRILVLEKGDIYAGLLVDKVFGMQHMPVDCFTREHNFQHQACESYTDGCYQHNGSEWMVFSPERLTEDGSFLDVASI